MSNSTPPQAVPLEAGSTEAAFYRVAVGEVAQVVNTLSAGIGTAKALALLSAAVGHLYGAIYREREDSGEGPHLHNFRVGIVEGKRVRLELDEPVGSA